MRQKTVEEDYFVAQYDRIVSGSQSFLYLESYFNIRLSFGLKMLYVLLIFVKKSFTKKTEMVTVFVKGLEEVVLLCIFSVFIC